MPYISNFVLHLLAFVELRLDVKYLCHFMFNSGFIFIYLFFSDLLICKFGSCTLVPNC